MSARVSNGVLGQLAGNRRGETRGKNSNPQAAWRNQTDRGRRWLKERDSDVPTCRDVSELVTDYLERRLPVTGWLGVRLHLLGCDACRRYIAQMRQTIRLIAASAFPAPGTDTEETVLRAVHGGAPPNSAPGD